MLYTGISKTVYNFSSVLIIGYNMKLAGITGSIGCGKTTLAKIAKGLGFAVYDVDGWVRKIYCNKNFLRELEKCFPDSVKNGIADKRHLRNLVFADNKKLKQLENLIHPFLDSKIRALVTKRAKKNDICFIDAALLFEKGWDRYCDIVILADVDYEIQKKRVMKRDGVTEEDFDKINNIQLNSGRKKMLSDIVIDTDKPLNKLKVEMIAVIKGLEEG